MQQKSLKQVSFKEQFQSINYSLLRVIIKTSQHHPKRVTVTNNS